MSDDASTIRRLLARRELAAVRHRAALGRRIGLRDTEMLAVSHLAQRGEMTPTDLAAALGLSSGGVSGLLQRLEAAGHLIRVPNPRDGRSRLVRLSPTIVERAEREYLPLVSALERLGDELDERDRSVVQHFLTRVASISEDHADRAQVVGRYGEPEKAPPVPSLWS